MTGYFRKFLIVYALAVAISGTAWASDERVLLARKAWSAWSCYVYASMGAKEAEAERLFKLGYAAAKEFVKAYSAGQFTREQISSSVPVGVAYILRGPSEEFVVGRIFAAVEEDAWDKVVKRDASNFPLSSDKWIMDKEVQRSKALGLFNSANCLVIR